MPAVKKPLRWATVQRGLVVPEWRWAWQGLRLALPLWEGAGKAYDPVIRRHTADNLLWVRDIYGVAADFGATGDDSAVATEAQVGIEAINTDAWTAVVFARHDGGAGTHPTLLSKAEANTGTQPLFMLVRADVTPRRLYNWEKEYAELSFNPTTDNKWHLYGISHPQGAGNGSGEFYGDGNKLTTVSGPGTHTANNAGWQLGANGTGSFVWQGQIGAVYLWNRALTANEHRALAIDPFGPFRLHYESPLRAPVAAPPSGFDLDRIERHFGRGFGRGYARGMG